ncbi:glycosyltransferase family 4 protein [Snuella sedimenti]|uniref:Glycosyltransferase family 4 protein n=1 Tax=Snuella sedimenti TaxID=2798802 RepID=A0A8J7J208_9FLAO|nr:glycosyltransferase family 4 protein [Snuella sedimenti]MBJ6368287.1 glycosyltransferase family 4 protein [Snuella sedimenti]
MTHILYIGNKLASEERNASAIDCLGPLLEGEGYRVYYASSKLNKIGRLLDMLWACWRYRHTVHMVLIDTYSTLNFWYALCVSQLCRLLKLKYIPILHGGNLPKRLETNPYLSRLLFCYAYKYVAPSAYLKKAFETHGYTNVGHIPNTLSLAMYPFKDRGFEQINLLWVRSFARIYHPELAVKILKNIQEQGVKASLCMVGPDSGDRSLQVTQTLAETLGVNVRVTGKLTKEAWIALSEDYNVFINTSNFDNMPVSVMEAMALGLPVVSTNVGGMPFLIDNKVNGILVPPNDEKAFTNALLAIYSRPQNALQMAKQARMVVEKIDWKQVRQLWRNVLQ